MKKLLSSRFGRALMLATFFVIVFVSGYYFGGRSAETRRTMTERVVISTEKLANGAASALEVPVLDVNCATARELETLPGIGEKLAERIISYREEIGTFKTVSQIVGVKGIGPEMLAQIEPYLTVQ